ncbi:MAG: hypothetical protein HOO67_05925 [Candidatus Peribacteraceae bacterium]|nr:hypothetical protein [Candidatus Peribacteraceae bacterium]
MHTDSLIPAARPTLSTILWRLSWPFFLFSFLFAALMAVSWTFLLPRYTLIDVGGTLRDAAQIRAYRSELGTQIAEKEERRRQLVLAVHDPQYETLKQQRRERVSLDELRKALSDHATKITGKEDRVRWSSFDYDPNAKTLHMRGYVGNVETRSMTVLAEFSQSLKSLPFVASATTPSFSREEDPKTGFHSPFDITLSLR